MVSLYSSHTLFFTYIYIYTYTHRQVDLLGSFRYRNCYETCVSMIASGRIDVQKLITHRYGLCLYVCVCVCVYVYLSICLCTYKSFISLLGSLYAIFIHPSISAYSLYAIFIHPSISAYSHTHTHTHTHTHILLKTGSISPPQAPLMPRQSQKALQNQRKEGR